MSDRTVAVLAPSVYVSITIEAAPDGSDDVHVHAGGQGIWVARMLRHLDEQPVVIAPVGGESGRALRGLIDEWGIQLQAITTHDPCPVYVHDRRSGSRRELARSRPPVLNRHETDELYNRTLQLALAAGTCVVTGPESGTTFPAAIYQRLAVDLAASGVPVIGDLHGDELASFLAGGPLAVLKISDSDLEEDGLLADDDATEASVIAVMDDLATRGVERVIVSRSDRPMLARFPDASYRVSGPLLEAVDTTGSGDSMTAALAAGLVRQVGREAMLGTAWAAGAANVTRRGLGSASPGLIPELAARVVVEPLAPT